MGQHKKQRTKDLVNSNITRMMLENASNDIEGYNFRRLVRSGFIVEESSAIPLQAPESPVSG